VSQTLAGLQVLDLSQHMAGALVTQLLADYGAEVVCIEPPGGSPLRRQPGWVTWGRGKRSVVLDLRDDTDARRARSLAEGADVLLEDFRPGKAERLGLGYDSLCDVNPGLVHASISGFGERGPYRDLKGYEALVMAKMGAYGQFAAAAPRPGPAFCAVPYATFGAAQAALQGILAAIYVRERSGVGQRVTTSLAQGVAAQDPWNWFLALVAQRYPDAFADAPPYSERGVPTQSFAFRLLVCMSRDGQWLQFSQTPPHLFKAFMRTLELDWMWDDPEWSTAPEFDSEEKRERFWEHMLEAARRKTVAEWQEVFEREPDVWAEVYRPVRDLLTHPQMRHNEQVIEVDDPHVGTTRQLAPMVKMSATPGRVQGPAPDLDADGAALRARADARPSRPRIASASTTPPAGRPPLEGLTVLDLGLFYAAPYGTALLADLGARVVKIEPLAGEPMRALMGYPDAGAVKSLQGKESVAVDAQRPEGREIVGRIVARCDLVMMSYRAGAAARLGLDAASVRALNPNIVYLNAPGYGVDGPCGRKPAFAPTIGAACGIGWLAAGASVPTDPELEIDELKHASIRLGLAAMAPGNADGCAALGVATALLLGLVARERTGKAQEMLTSMLCTSGYAISEHCFDHEGRSEPQLVDAELHGLGALYRLYEAGDGWVFLASPEEGEWTPLCRALEPYSDLAGDARFADTTSRRHNDAALADVLASIFRTRAAADWESSLRAADVGCVEVSDGPIARVFVDDPILEEAGMLAEVEHPSFGRHRRLAPLVELSGTPGEARPACLLGQHTASVLREVGYSDEAITRLEAEGVILCSRDA